MFSDSCLFCDSVQAGEKLQFAALYRSIYPALQIRGGINPIALRMAKTL